MTGEDEQRELVEGDNEPSSERFIHTEIYRARPDVTSVVHTHQPMATLLGIVGLPILPLLHVESLVVAQQPVPIFACAELIVSAAQGQAVARALGDHPRLPPAGPRHRQRCPERAGSDAGRDPSGTIG